MSATLRTIAKALGGEITGKSVLAPGPGHSSRDRSLSVTPSPIREAFGSLDRISSEALVAALVDMKDRPWGECNHGKALTQNQLARKLKPFGLKPKNIKEADGRVPKGYMRADFEETCERYLPDRF
jgi:hypothetical protein